MREITVLLYCTDRATTQQLHKSVHLKTMRALSPQVRILKDIFIRLWVKTTNKIWYRNLCLQRSKFPPNIQHAEPLHEPPENLPVYIAAQHNKTYRHVQNTDHSHHQKSPEPPQKAQPLKHELNSQAECIHPKYSRTSVYSEKWSGMPRTQTNCY